MDLLSFNLILQLALKCLQKLRTDAGEVIYQELTEYEISCYMYLEIARRNEIHLQLLAYQLNSDSIRSSCAKPFFLLLLLLLLLPISTGNRLLLQLDLHSK